MTIRNWQQLLGGLGGFVARGVVGLIVVASVTAVGAAEANEDGGLAPFQVAQADPPAEDEPRPPAPPADDDIEEIVVLGAESESAEDYGVGDSVTGFGAEDLAALGAASIADLASFTPNLEIVTSGATTPTFFIRGVGLNDFNANSTGAVAIYVDDVAVNAPALQLSSLFDMEAVNVLRGPQGTGLARNSSAGAIKLYSRKPTGEFGGFLRAEGGNFAFQDYEGAIEAPIVEDLLAARFAFRLSKRDGTMKNRCGGAPPRELRTPRPRPAQQATANDVAPWSICGEPVTILFQEPIEIRGTSDVPADLARHLNDRDTWAARGTFLVEPTLDTTFLIGLHGSRRDEFTRVGQSIGTGGFYCLDGDIANCGVEVGQGGSLVTNLLGGRQGNAGYQPFEIKKRLTELAPCYNFGAFGGDVACGSSAANPNFAGFDRAKRIVSRELSKDLDEEPWEGDFNHDGRTINDTWGAYLKGEIALPWNLELTSVTGYDTYERLISIDLDFSPETLFHIFTEDEGWQVTQDVQLAGELELVDESPIFWDVGGFMLHEKLDVNIVNDFGALTQFSVGERDYQQTLTSFGGYGHFSFDFWDDFSLDGGTRFNYEEKEIDYVLFELSGVIPTELFEQDVWRAVTGTLRLTYRFREDAHAFWKYTRGWKPGHYNATGSRVRGVTIADPEFIDAFETGLRASWFDRRLTLDLSLFYYNYKDYQIFTAQQFAGTGPEFVILNANDAEVYGAELELLVRPWDGMFVQIRPSWLESQFLDFVLVQQAVITRNNQNVLVNRELQNSGNPLLNSPQFKVSFTVEQTIPLGPGARHGMIVPRWDGVWTDDTFYDATAGMGIPTIQGINYPLEVTFAQRAYWLHNFRLAYRPPGSQVEIAGWVRNAFDTPYKQFGFDGSTFQRTTIYFVGDPRTFGATVTVNF